MDFGRKYMATVSYAPNEQACYVRCKVSRPNEKLPLSIKASFTGIPREFLIEGTIVKVMRSSMTDHTKYNVVDMVCNNGVSDIVSSPGKMSQDRIQFILPPRYFQTRQTSNGMRRETCVNILAEVFGLCPADWNRFMCQYPHGITILCRPSQFARFIVRRFEADECINGVKDLDPSIELSTKPVTLYDQAAHVFGSSLSFVHEAMGKLGISNHVYERPDVIDVSKNKYDVFKAQWS